ncbi:hypothetical protein RZS08_31295, partial [Arthrospira platensis SPKY1]|nr:hypothetical protein [Arthrospira platensis SPKY1]
MAEAGTSLSPLDSALVFDPVLREQLLNHLGEAFGVLSYADSGFLEKSEYVWMREITQSTNLGLLLDRLVQRGLVGKEQDAYVFYSAVLAGVLSHRMAVADRYYLLLDAEVVVMAERIGLCRNLLSDR